LSTCDVLIEKFTNQLLHGKVSSDNATPRKVKLGDLLQTSLVGFYFDAKWCPPGEQFLPQLDEIYIEAKRQRLNLEIVYVSCDLNEKKCYDVFQKSHGDWLMWPFDKNSIKYFIKISRK
jgi:thiol-disulfide isomerase/thioredoxin